MLPNIHMYITLSKYYLVNLNLLFSCPFIFWRFPKFAAPSMCPLFSSRHSKIWLIMMFSHFLLHNLGENVTNLLLMVSLSFVILSITSG